MRTLSTQLLKSSIFIIFICFISCSEKSDILLNTSSISSNSATLLTVDKNSEVITLGNKTNQIEIVAFDGYMGRSEIRIYRDNRLIAVFGNDGDESFIKLGNSYDLKNTLITDNAIFFSNSSGEKTTYFSPEHGIVLNNKQVLSKRQPAIDNATDATTTTEQLNKVIAALREHGLIEK